MSVRVPAVFAVIALISFVAGAAAWQLMGSAPGTFPTSTPQASPSPVVSASPSPTHTTERSPTPGVTPEPQCAVVITTKSLGKSVVTALVLDNGVRFSAVPEVAATFLVPCSANGYPATAVDKKNKRIGVVNLKLTPNIVNVLSLDRSNPLPSPKPRSSATSEAMSGTGSRIMSFDKLPVRYLDPTGCFPPSSWSDGDVWRDGMLS